MSPTSPAQDSEASPYWYREAVIYQVHVRSFNDSNGDGIGDFQGLTQKLDYIQSLGVTAIWLLPFFPSPLRDDGYDIADYTGINPSYGTLEDFEEFVKEAHRRDLRVITEMVLNHTSDQHEWFQKSRRARPGEKWRDFYVWSDTDELYQEARIIFQDFETSNWTWDPVADAYFWHRFYHHQPDLNFDNPEVHKAMLEVIDFWLEKGVDGVRLDAVPYLYEREGTNCENLEETHQFLKKLRAHVDERFPGCMLLAEANQWPEDAAAYFGDGDECHMNFHFPLMPRLFMAVEREDRFPVIDILEQTPPIPENCQWGIFLRNHDELTLEMVTDEERDYMYRAYADDLRARVNLGIRRRLAPLLRDHRGKIELMNALLLSLPGTPIIYYGDEIRMGDNIYLGDRDGVRTPMQWNEDRNAGFSRANPQQLFLPVIIDRTFHYASRNVEVEQGHPHSMLRWMRRIITLRRHLTVFGRGSIEFLQPDNAKVLAYLREFEGEVILVVANLSRYVQCVELDMSRYRGATMVELFGQTRFPPLGELPYFLTLGPYSFYWFRVEQGKDEAGPMTTQLPRVRVSAGWDEAFEGRALAALEDALPAYLYRQRWFAGKARAVQTVSLLDVLNVDHAAETGGEQKGASSRLPEGRLLIVQVEYVEGEPDIYVLPVLFAQGQQEENILGDRPGAGLVSVVRSSDGATSSLCDASREEALWRLLFESIAGKRSFPGRNGRIQAYQTEWLEKLSGDMTREFNVFGGEQSNTSASIGGRFVLKLFRRTAAGENPDLEIGRYLTENTDLSCVPRVAGALEYRQKSGPPFTLAMLHEYVSNEGDGWTYTLDELGRFLERTETGVDKPPLEEIPPGLSLVELAGLAPGEATREAMGTYLWTAELLGRRTAEMHLALASGNDEGFAPQAYTRLYQRSLYQSIRSQTRRSLGLLARRLDTLPSAAQEQARRVLGQEDALLEQCQELASRPITAQRTRNHGDFHLGQVLFTGKDFAIVDFEGEPSRPLSERRIKSNPLRDVAGMLRSFHYASNAVRHGPEGVYLSRSTSTEEVSQRLNTWYVWSAASFLRGYLEETSGARFLPHAPGDLTTLLNAYLLEKAAYELVYELNNRPSWVLIPLEGILLLLQEAQPLHEDQNTSSNS